MAFLMNEVVLEPISVPTMLADPSFPMTPSEFATLTLGEIAEMGRQEFLRDQDFARRNRKAAAKLAGLVVSKAAVNAMRIAADPTGKAKDGVGVIFGNMELHLIAEIMRRYSAGDLTIKDVDKLIWTRLRKD